MEANKPFHTEILPDAFHDMTEIISTFLMLGSKNGAMRIREKFTKIVELISEQPYCGVTVSDDKLARLGYRMIIIEKYLVFYRVFEDENKVIIYRVLNGKMNYPTLLNRMERESE